MTLFRRHLQENKAHINETEEPSSYSTNIHKSSVREEIVRPQTFPYAVIECSDITREIEDDKGDRPYLASNSRREYLYIQ